MKKKTKHKSFRLREDLIALAAKKGIDLTDFINSSLEKALVGKVNCPLCNGKGKLG